VLLCAAVVLPILALLGDYQGGRAIQRWRTIRPGDSNYSPDRSGRLPNAALTIGATGALSAHSGSSACPACPRRRSGGERWGGTFLVTYPQQRNVRVPIGFSVLEASRVGVSCMPAICGGRDAAHCRIRVMECTVPVPERMWRTGVLDRAALHPPCGSPAAAPTGRYHSWCHCWPTPRGRRIGNRASHVGEERFVVHFVVDMRDSNPPRRTCLPFEHGVHNRPLHWRGDAGVVEAGGRTAQFTGDGLVALFGSTAHPRKPAARRSRL